MNGQGLNRDILSISVNPNVPTTDCNVCFQPKEASRELRTEMAKQLMTKTEEPLLFPLLRSAAA